VLRRRTDDLGAGVALLDRDGLDPSPAERFLMASAAEWRGDPSVALRLYRQALAHEEVRTKADPDALETAVLVALDGAGTQTGEEAERIRDEALGWLAAAAEGRKRAIASLEAALRDGRLPEAGWEARITEAALQRERSALKEVESSEPRYAPLRGRPGFRDLFPAREADGAPVAR
jgi:hypothetical protein